MLHVPHGISRRTYQTVATQPLGSGRCWTDMQAAYHEVARLQRGLLPMLQPNPPFPGLL